MKRIISLVLACVLLVGCVFTFASCAKPNSDPEKAKEALEDADYAVTYVNEDTPIAGALLPDGVVATIVAFDKNENYIAITYYESKDDVNDAWEDAEEDAKELEEEYENIVCKKSGKMIYIGTEDAVKAAK